jgi:hypothetical protein
LKQESYCRIFPGKPLFPKKKRKNYFVLNALIPLLHAGAFHMQDHHLQKVIYRMAKIHCDEEIEEEKTRIFSTWSRGRM